MTLNWTPELLSPAGNLEKLKVAVLYGADAVYVGGQKFGLRSAADNFTSDELVEGVSSAHSRDSKVFVVLNSFFHDGDLEELPPFIKLLDDLNVDAVIVSDLGVVKEVSKLSNIPIHLSTQASCLNSSAAKFWKEMGVSRIVLGREVSLKEAAEIKKATDLEVEMFIHGSMCMAYSGNCVISNYTSGRDSNRGGCAHSCRFEYSLEDSSKQKKNTYFMSSKDLEGVKALPDFIEAGIDSLKVEGRMKGHHYAGTISKVYSEALSFFEREGHFLSDDLVNWEKELGKVTHRDYHTGSFYGPAGSDSVYSEREHDEQQYNVVGIVLEVIEEQFLLIEVRGHFSPGDHLEIIPFKGNSVDFTLSRVDRVDGEACEKTAPGTLVKIPYVPGVQKWNLIRKRLWQ
jgi:putative protease